MWSATHQNATSFAQNAFPESEALHSMSRSTTSPFTAVCRLIVVLCAAPAVSMTLCGSAHAEGGGQFYGLLRSRDLSPFGFLRLDMRPAHAVAIDPGTWAIET